MFLKYIFLIFIFFTYSLKACEKPKMPSTTEWNDWLEDVRDEAKSKNIRDVIPFPRTPGNCNY